ncbi:metallophosphoesterase [Stylonychia lemnae]|uniref:Metallophosphoesterase n=1 Tax=Stylonychia lemnae TaxID=5949 RepID=A0A078AQ32_STYLE|nr:metallophosphoesterase [Stylonychia lemnae]|eukprot:CDW83053.1 metallophosphoesterase [Stylonychia lemnae]
MTCNLLHDYSYLRLTYTLLLACFFFNQGLLKDYKQLQYNKNGKFKIVQLTDIHFGETDSKDRRSQDVIRTVIELEQPDLVVVTGDVVSGYEWDDKSQGFFASNYGKMTSVLEELNVHWAFTAGNHDTEGDLNRAQVSYHDQSFSLSLTRPNAANISYEHNYVIPVYNQNGSKIEFRLWFLDSGYESNCRGLQGYDCIQEDQINWYRSEHSKISDNDSSKGRGFLFMHIPIQQYINLYNYGTIYGNRGEDICCGAYDTGLFGAIIEQSTVEWISCGHDHNNDYHGNYEGVNLAYGRKTGYGGYQQASIKKGARVFEITQEPYNIKTWIRQEDGTIDFNDMLYSLHRTHYDFQKRCCNTELIEEQVQVTYTYYYFLIALIAIFFLVMDSIRNRHLKKKINNQDNESSQKLCKELSTHE